SWRVPPAFKFRLLGYSSRHRRESGTRLDAGWRESSPHRRRTRTKGRSGHAAGVKASGSSVYPNPDEITRVPATCGQNFDHKFVKSFSRFGKDFSREAVLQSTHKARQFFRVYEKSNRRLVCFRARSLLRSGSPVRCWQSVHSSSGRVSPCTARDSAKSWVP